MRTCGLLLAGLIVVGAGAASTTGPTSDAVAAASDGAAPLADPLAPADPLNIVAILPMLIASIAVVAIIWILQLYRLPREADRQRDHRWLVRFPLLGLGLVPLFMFIPPVITALTIGLPGPGDASDTASPLKEQVLINTIYLGVSIAMMGGLWCIWMQWRNKALSGPSMSLMRGAAVATLALIAAVPVLSVLSWTVAALITLMTGEAPANIAHGTLTLLVESDADLWRWGMIAAAVLGAPIVEEVLYRGCLQAGIVGLSAPPWTAIVITSGLFTAMHIAIVDWNALVTLFALSLVMGWVYERTGRLSAAVLLHMLFNGLNVALAFAVAAEEAGAA